MTAAFPHDFDQPVYVISVAAQLAGMHAQTLRQYDRLGIVTPTRSRGGGRRYSQRDVSLLREVQQLSHEGVSLAGIARVIELRAQVEQLQRQVDELELQLRASRTAPRVFAADTTGQIVALRPGQRPTARATGRSLVLYGRG